MMALDPAARDSNVTWVLSRLDELRTRPSQHTAAWTRVAADEAHDLIESLVTDLRGWEQEA